MKFRLLSYLLLTVIITACNPMPKAAYIFFFHNRFLENHPLEAAHPTYGIVEYAKIIAAFEAANFEVISEKRAPNTNARDYALNIKTQIDSLLALGIAPNKITVIGTSKGGYIAQYVSTFTRIPDLNFVFIGSYRDRDLVQIPEINFCGNILNIYEQTDPFGVSAIKRKENSTLEIPHFKEIALNTGLKHGFLFKADQRWIQPCIQWAKQAYSKNTTKTKNKLHE